MPIDTPNKKLAIMELEEYTQPGLPRSPGALGQDDRQQLLWGYPGILWQGPTVIDTGGFGALSGPGVDHPEVQALPGSFILGD